MSQEKIIKLLQKLDSPTLEGLSGKTIVRAVRIAFDTNRESELAKLVCDRYGLSILAEKKVRKAIILSLSIDESIEHCASLNIKQRSGEFPQDTLISYFNLFTEEKSEQFTGLFGLEDAYIIRKLSDDRQASEALLRKYGDPIDNPKGYLHPYQVRIKDKVITCLQKGDDRIMVQMPTGAGKTATALETVVDLFREPLEKNIVLWLVDSSELAEQALDTFKSLWFQKGDRPVSVHRMFGGFTPNFSEHPYGFVVSTFDKLRGPVFDSNHNNHSVVWHVMRNMGLLIVDEAHTSVADTYEDIIRRLINCADAKLVGLSATPARNSFSGTFDLNNLYSSNLVSITNEDAAPISDAVGYLQKNGYLAYIETTELPSGSSVEGKDEKTICKSLAEDENRNQLILKQIELAISCSEPTLIFSCTKDHVFALMALCRASSIHAEFIVGDTPQHERNRILDEFRNGVLNVIINHEILATGVDLPNLRKVIVTRPVGSSILYSQILGRALRGPKNGGQELNKVVSIRDNLINYTSANLVYQTFADNFLYPVQS